VRTTHQDNSTRLSQTELGLVARGTHSPTHHTELLVRHGTHLPVAELTDIHTPQTTNTHRAHSAQPVPESSPVAARQQPGNHYGKIRLPTHSGAQHPTQPDHDQVGAAALQPVVTAGANHAWFGRRRHQQIDTAPVHASPIRCFHS